jgi:hypothetical protein
VVNQTMMALDAAAAVTNGDATSVVATRILFLAL